MKKIGAREVPCPGCGYDLRAAVGVEGGVRCPECGAVVRAGEASRVPWVGRRHVGRVRAYGQTVWMVVRWPGELGREVGQRVSGKAARGFHRVSMVLAAGIGAGFVGATFLLDRPSLPDISEGSYWITPAFALADRWWAVFLLAYGLWLGLSISLAGYRWILRVGYPVGFMRRRVGAIGLYASGAAVVQAGLLGMGYYLLVVALKRDAWIDSWRPWIWTVCAGLGLMAVGIYLYSTVMLIARMGRRAATQYGLALLFPAFVWIAMVAMTVAMFWVAGFVAMAVWSMTR